MFFSNHPEQFRNILFQQLMFEPEQREHYLCYQRPGLPEAGFYHHYSREGFYAFGIGEYTIEHPFSIQFDNPEPLLRMGIVYDGETIFRLERQQPSSFRPSPFLVLEKGIRGRQIWRAGQHFRGAEIFMYPEFLKELSGRFPGFGLTDSLVSNHTYYDLPADMVPVFHRLMDLDRKDGLNPICLEAQMLECVGILQEYGRQDAREPFFDRTAHGSIHIGNGHRLNFSTEDLKSIQKAHRMLTEQFVNPPAIGQLSRALLINPQKLKAGFSYYYHMTMGDYVSFLRMSRAAALLRTTEKSVAEIAGEVGYGYPSNFIKKFVRTYSCTPLKYRIREREL